jgi:hypothetical protein
VDQILLPNVIVDVDRQRAGAVESIQPVATRSGNPVLLARGDIGIIGLEPANAIELAALFLTS